MNQEFYEHAKKIIDELTIEEIAESLREFGIEATIRQYPEQKEESENNPPSP